MTSTLFSKRLGCSAGERVLSTIFYCAHELSCKTDVSNSAERPPPTLYAQGALRDALGILETPSLLIYLSLSLLLQNEAVGWCVIHRSSIRWRMKI